MRLFRCIIFLSRIFRNKSAFFAILDRIFFIVKADRSSFEFISFHSSGVDTVGW